MLVLVGMVATDQPALANPATSVAFAPESSATHYAGYAFDACTAPPVSTIQAWQSSPYRALAVYAGGLNRTCKQPELTASWVRQVTALGWRLLPVYKGLQPACGARPRDTKIATGWETQQGTAAAQDAVAAERALGMLAGSPAYLDIEQFDTTNVPCRTSVLKFTSAFTAQMHRRGYLAGVYMNLNYGARVLSAAYSSTAYARPDALWIARWDGSTALTGWAGIPNAQWATHQRAKQYHGDHQETYGGVTVNIDSNRVDALAATVATGSVVTGSAPVTARRGPTPTAPAVREYEPGDRVAVVCQTPGPKVGTSTLWSKLPNGTYIAAYYTRPRSSGPTPTRCMYPYQVTAPSTLSERSGPGASYPVKANLSTGGLAWVVCQRTGSKVGGTTVWNRLSDSLWVTDYYVATPSATSYSAPVPRC